MPVYRSSYSTVHYKRLAFMQPGISAGVWVGAVELSDWLIDVACRRTAMPGPSRLLLLLLYGSVLYTWRRMITVGGGGRAVFAGGRPGAARGQMPIFLAAESVER